MLTKRDVQKVHSQMTNELNASPRTVLVCALLLLLLACVAWLGTAYEDDPVSFIVESTR